MIYIGDALFPGGNDAPARETGVDCIQVRDPQETKRVIEAIVACLHDDAPTPQSRLHDRSSRNSQLFDREQSSANR
jgi:hypothetical protein